MKYEKYGNLNENCTFVSATRIFPQAIFASHSEFFTYTRRRHGKKMS
jgi:hypothetical protein